MRDVVKENIESLRKLEKRPEEAVLIYLASHYSLDDLCLLFPCDFAHDFPSSWKIFLY